MKLPRHELEILVVKTFWVFSTALFFSVFILTFKMSKKSQNYLVNGAANNSKSVKINIKLKCTCKLLAPWATLFLQKAYLSDGSLVSGPMGADDIYDDIQSIYTNFIFYLDQKKKQEFFLFMAILAYNTPHLHFY